MKPMLVALGVAAALAGTAFADVTVKNKVIDHKKGGTPQTQLIKASGKKLNFSLPPSAEMKGKRGPSRGSSRAIWDGDTKTLIVEDDQNKTFTKIDEKLLEQYSAMGAATPQVSADAKKRLEAAEAELEKALENAPPGQKDFIKKMFDQRLKGLRDLAGGEESDWRIEKVGPVMVGTVMTTQYRVWEGKVLEKEIHSVPFTVVGPAKEAHDAYAGFVDFMKGMPGAMGENGKRMAKEFETINGFPYLTREYEDGKLVHESTFDGTTTEKLDPKEFERNPTYTEQKMPKPGAPPPGMPPMPPR